LLLLDSQFGGMRIGDLVRYKEIIRHDHPQILTEWKLGLMVAKEYNLVRILCRDGKIKTIYSYLVEKAGKKDAQKDK
jgi:hypothetical protein